jgi:hypothetical protein
MGGALRVGQDEAPAQFPGIRLPGHNEWLLSAYLLSKR